MSRAPSQQYSQSPVIANNGLIDYQDSPSAYKAMFASAAAQYPYQAAMSMQAYPASLPVQAGYPMAPIQAGYAATPVYSAPTPNHILAQAQISVPQTQTYTPGVVTVVPTTQAEPTFKLQMNGRDYVLDTGSTSAPAAPAEPSQRRIQADLDRRIAQRVNEFMSTGLGSARSGATKRASATRKVSPEDDEPTDYTRELKKLNAQMNKALRKTTAAR